MIEDFIISGHKITIGEPTDGQRHMRCSCKDILALYSGYGLTKIEKTSLPERKAEKNHRLAASLTNRLMIDRLTDSMSRRSETSS